eukprot:scaffold130241_cov65-Attheya_sp.AAC.12
MKVRWVECEIGHWKTLPPAMVQRPVGIGSGAGQDMEHVFGTVSTTVRVSFMGLMFPSFEILADSENPCNLFSPAIPMSP